MLPKPSASLLKGLLRRPSGDHMVGQATHREGVRRGNAYRRSIRQYSPNTQGMAKQSKKSSLADTASATSRQVVSRKGQSMVGKGLSSMREHKVKTGMVAATGMGIAASVRNTGHGSSSGSTSIYG